MFLKLERVKVISGVACSVLKSMIVDYGDYDMFSIVFILSNLYYVGWTVVLFLSSQCYVCVG